MNTGQHAMLAVVKRLMPGKAEDIAGLQQEIDRVKADGAAACAEIEQLDQQRALAPSYGAAVAGDERSKQLRWTVDHANAVLPELEARLAQAIAARHQAAIARHRATGAQVYGQLRAALVEAGKAQALALQARQEAIAEIGEGQTQLHLPVVAFMGLLTPDLLQLYFDQMDRVMAPPPKPKPVVAAPKSLPPKPRPMIEMPATAPVRAGRVQRADPTPHGEDQRSVVFLRGGCELEDGSQSIIGDRCAMPAEIARRHVLAGNAEFVA